MSTHLLPVSKGMSNTVMRYISTNTNVNRVYETLLCEHDRMLYIGIGMGTFFRIQKMNLFTNEIITIAEMSYTLLDNGWYVGGMLVDDNYIYLKLCYGTAPYKIHRYSLKLNTIDSYAFATSASVTCGKIDWYDETNIIIMANTYNVMFDTVKCTFTKSSTLSSSRNMIDFAIGESLIIGTSEQTSSTIMNIYDKSSDTFSNEATSSSGVGCICYNNGLFYIAQSNLLSIYDETTRTIIASYTVPWSTPCGFNYCNGKLYCIQYNSETLFVYDLSNNTYERIILRWKLSNTGSTRQLPIVFDDFYFIQNISLGLILNDANSAVKYMFGYKQRKANLIMCDSNHESKFEYDPETTSFSDTFLTVNDISISKQLISSETNAKIKYAHVNKNEYNKIKSIEIIEK